MEAQDWGASHFLKRVSFSMSQSMTRGWWECATVHAFWGRAWQFFINLNITLAGRHSWLEHRPDTPRLWVRSLVTYKNEAMNA